MRVGVLGTGMVGVALATRLVEVGHDVVMGSRTPDNEKAMAWAASQPERAAAGTFADAASHGEIVVNATSGIASLAALTAAGEENLAGKVLVDVANPIASYGPRSRSSRWPATAWRSRSSALFPLPEWSRRSTR